VLPNTHDVVALLAKLTSLPVITPPVFVYLVPPKLRSRSRNAALAHGTSMPETTVDEYRQPMTGEVEIWLSKNLSGVLLPTLDFRFDQRELHLLFGRPIAFTSNFGHPGGTFGFAERICHALAFQPD
jgi:hypothetical protein